MGLSTMANNIWIIFMVFMINGFVAINNEVLLVDWYNWWLL